MVAAGRVSLSRRVGSFWGSAGGASVSPLPGSVPILGRQLGHLVVLLSLELGVVALLLLPLLGSFGSLLVAGLGVASDAAKIFP